MNEINLPQDVEAMQQYLTDVSRDRLSAAKYWKANGGKVVGYLSNNIPLEIFHAAGVMPVLLHGDPDQVTPLADEFLEPAFDPFSRSIFDRILNGSFDFLDAIVLPRTHDSLQRLYYYLREIERKHPQYKTPPVFLFNLLQTNRESTRHYNQRQAHQLTDFLGDIGNSVTQQQLIDSTIIYNAIRRSLEKFSELLAQYALPNRINFDIYTACQSLSADDALSLVEQVNTLIVQANLPLRDKCANKIVVAGSGLDHVQLHQTLDSLSINTVGDFHVFGNQFLPLPEVPTNGNIVEHLVDTYQKHTANGRSFSTSPSDVVNFAKQQNANGVLFYYLLKEEALSWQLPKQSKAAEAQGLQTSVLSDQPYAVDEEAVASAIKSFHGKEKN